MKLSYLISLYFISIGILLFVSSINSLPGYMDADYYYATAKQIQASKQFFEPFLWNYLIDPTGIPTPSFTYWMPLTALISSAGMALISQDTFFAARFLLIMLAGLVSPFTAILSYELDKNRMNALWAGVLAFIPGYYLVFLSTTDSFGITMILGGACLYSVSRFANKPANKYALSFGLLSGLLHLSRADGILWLFVGIISFVCIGYGNKLSIKNQIIAFLLIILGYLLIMFPWYFRNVQMFRQLMPPGSTNALWLTNYDELFRFPSSQINFNKWLDSGLKEIIRVRLWAASQNLLSFIGVQGVVVLLPLMIIGVWKFRKHWSIRTAILYWILLFITQSLFFPFSGVRGSFFHSGSSIQILLWAVVPSGFHTTIEYGAKIRNWNINQAKRFFMIGITGIVILITVFVSISRLRGDMVFLENNKVEKYLSVSSYLDNIEGTDNYLVMINNPPRYFLSTDMPSIVIPDKLDSMFSAAKYYGAKYLILEPNANFPNLYSSQITAPELELIKVIDEIQIYEIIP